MNREFHEWMDARPMETTIDLSEPNQVITEFIQTCHSSHGEAIYLHCVNNRGSDTDPNQLLQGLSGRITISDPDGNLVCDTKFPGPSFANWSDDILLAQFIPFSTGEFLATITVETGAPALAEKEQIIYAKYLLCGLEQFPAVIAGALAIATGIVAFVSLCLVLPGLFESGIWKETKETWLPPDDQ